MLCTPEKFWGPLMIEGVYGIVTRILNIVYAVISALYLGSQGGLVGCLLAPVRGKPQIKITKYKLPPPKFKNVCL